MLLDPLEVLSVVAREVISPLFLPLVARVTYRANRQGLHEHVSGTWS